MIIFAPISENTFVAAQSRNTILCGSVGSDSKSLRSILAISYKQFNLSFVLMPVSPLQLARRAFIKILVVFALQYIVSCEH